MKQHSKFKPVTWSVVSRNAPLECARTPSGKHVPSYLFMDASMLPKRCRTRDAAQSSYHLDSQLSYLRDFTRKTHTSPSWCSAHSQRWKWFVKCSIPQGEVRHAFIEVIDGNASERKQKAPLTKNTKEKNFSGHDGGHVTIFPMFKPVVLSMASCSPTSSFSQQPFNEDTPGSFPQVAEVLMCSGLYQNPSEPSTGDWNYKWSYLTGILLREIQTVTVEIWSL